MNDKDLKIIENVKGEISKIDKKENRIYFFVIDTKGVSSGSLEYIYNLALFLKEEGYDVSMLHTEDEFVGVESWLGSKYADLQHYNVNTSEIGASPSDLLFIPEIFSQVMNQTKNLPCKRVAILQNYDYVVEQMPFVAQWGDFGILEGITNSTFQMNELNESFPYVKLTKVTPFISNLFGDTMEPKKMVVNIICNDQSITKKIVKPFYWKYPMFKWVSFKEVRNLPKEDFAKTLREGAITVVVDDNGSFCYSALEAVKSGSVVLCKVPETTWEWLQSENGELPNCCVWFSDYGTLHKQLASVVRSWVMDKIPEVLSKEGDKVCSKYTREETKKEFISYVNDVLSRRKMEMEGIIKQIENKNEQGNA